MRFLNRRTFVPARLILDGDDRFYLEFLDIKDGTIRSRRLSLDEDETAEVAR